ncbi:hypothetical protein KKG61_05730 [bacterium]|nr:hypothetical protein [bacterium]
MKKRRQRKPSKDYAYLFLENMKFKLIILRFLLLIPLIVFGSETDPVKPQETYYLPVDWVNQIIATKGTHSYLYAATYFGVYKSEDKGVTWHAENEGLESLITNGLLVTDRKLYAATDEGVFMKEISSPLWEKASLSDLFIYSLANLGSTLYAGALDKIWRSRDEGMNWEIAKEGVGTILAIVATNGCLLAVSYENGVFVSYNKGESWENIGPEDMGARDLIVTENKLYLATEEGFMYTSDWNNDWASLNYGLFSKELTTIAVAKDRFYVGSLLGGVFQSKDYGQGWDPINTGLNNTNILHLLVDPDDEKRLYAATEGGIYITETQGAVWKKSSGLIRVEENPPLYITPESVRERMKKLGRAPPAKEGGGEAKGEGGH